MPVSEETQSPAARGVSQIGKVHEKPSGNDSSAMRITLDEPMLVGGREGKDTPALFMTTVLRIGRDKVLFDDTYAGLPAVVGPENVFSVGAKGEGPGEFKGVSGVAFDQDTIYVLGMSGQFALFDPNGKFIRSFLLRGVTESPIVRGKNILTAHSPTPVAASAFAVVDHDGKVIREVGPHGPIVMGRSYVLGGNGTQFVAAPSHSGTYLIWYYSSRGDSLRAVRRPDLQSAFNPVSRKPCGNVKTTSGTSPGATITAIHLDENDRTWVMIAHKVDRCPSFTPPMGAPADPVGLDELRDVRIEVYERGRSNPVATLVLDEWLGGFVDDHHVWRKVSMEDGNEAVEIWRISLQKSAQKN